MTLNDLFETLAVGELSNLLLVSGDTLSDPKKKAVTLYANEGLLRLFTRFPLSEKDLLIEMQDGVTNYHLLPRYSLTGYDPEADVDPYIIDSADPFTGDVIRVVRVYNAYGVELPLNDEANQLSVFTPQPRILNIPTPVAGSTLDVVYRAQHPKLSVTSPDQEIELPDAMLPALQMYIGYKVLTAIGTQEGITSGAIKQGQFDAMCAEFVEQDIVGATTSTTNTKFNARGWK